MINWLKNVSDTVSCNYDASGTTQAKLYGAVFPLMATHGTGREMAKKDKSHQKLYGNASHGRGKNGASLVSGCFKLFFRFVSLPAREIDREASKKKIKPTPLHLISFLPISMYSTQNRGSEKIASFLFACSLRTAINWVLI